MTVEIVERVAAKADVDPFDLSPLASVIDPDALEKLLSKADRDDAAELEIEFLYEGYAVSVASDGTISVED